MNRALLWFSRSCSGRIRAHTLYYWGVCAVTSLYGDPVMPDCWSNCENGKHSPMPTAIFIVYTRDGFVIGADGRQRKGEIESAEIVADNAQKIFPIENRGRSLAYALVGTVGLGNPAKSDEVVMDLTWEIRDAANLLANKQFVEPAFYMKSLCRPAHDNLVKAKESGKITYPNNPEEGGFNEPGMAIARVFVLGYHNHIPSFYSVRFFHRNQDLGALLPQAIQLQPRGGTWLRLSKGLGCPERFQGQTFC